MGHEAIVDHVGRRFVPGPVHAARSLGRGRKPGREGWTGTIRLDSSDGVR